MHNTGEIKIYRTQGGQTDIDVQLRNDTVWLNRQQMATLFGRDVKTISKRIQNALNKELADIPFVAKFATNASDGKTYQVESYSLEMKGYYGKRLW